MRYMLPKRRHTNKAAIAAAGFILLAVAGWYGARRVNARRRWLRDDQKADQASEDSFPASDPPALTAAT